MIPTGTYTVLVRASTTTTRFSRSRRGRNVTVTPRPATSPPVANFTVSCTQNVCTFDGRTSTDENAPTLTYSWNFGNGRTGSGPLPTQTYTAAGTFTVTLTVRDECGLTSDRSPRRSRSPSRRATSAPIPVINPPTCTGLVCNSRGVGSADPNTGDTFTYLWNFGDGTATSTSSAPSHTFPAAGTYTVTLTVTDGWGKAATTTRQVTVSAP